MRTKSNFLSVIRVSTALAILLVADVGLVISQENAHGPAASNHRLTLVYNDATRSYELYDVSAGLVLSAGIINSGDQDESLSTNQPGLSRTVKGKDENKLIIE